MPQSLISKLRGRGLTVPLIEDHADRPDDEEEMFPDDAQRIEVDDDEESKLHGKGKKTGTDELLPTSLALVAPDCTPEAEQALSPSMVPPAQPPLAAPVVQSMEIPPSIPEKPVDDPALKAVLGKQVGSVNANINIPGIPSPAEYSATESMSSRPAGAIIAEAMQPGSPMPEHKPADISRVMPNIRRYLRV